LSISRLVTVLGHHWFLVAVLTAALTAGVAAVTYSTAPSYRASALLEVQAPMDTTGSISLEDTLTARERAVTIAALGNTAQVARRAGAALGAVRGLRQCSFSQAGQSEFLHATCAGGARSEVAPAANAYAIALQRLLEAQRSARIAELTRLYQEQVRTMRAQGVSATNFPTQPVYPSYREVEIIDPARTPSSAYAPRPVRTLAIAVVLGLLVNIGLAFLLENVQNRARSPEELQRALELPVLATLPQLGRGVGVVGRAPARGVAATARHQSGVRAGGGA
jgi:capsular polysaccharide biosynthesis protein